MDSNKEFCMITTRRSFMGAAAIGLFAPVTALNLTNKALPSIIKLFGIKECNGIPVKEIVFPKGKAICGFIMGAEGPLGNSSDRQIVLVPGFSMTEQGYILSRRGKPFEGDRKTPNPPTVSVLEQIKSSIACCKNSGGTDDPKEPIIYVLRNEENGEMGIVVLDGNKKWNPIFNEYS